MLQLIPLETQGARGPARALLMLGAGTMTASWLSIWVTLLAAAIGSPVLLPGPALEAIVLAAAAAARRLLVSPLGERAVRALFTAGALPSAAIAVGARFSAGRPPPGPLWPPQPAEPVVATALVALSLWWTGGRIGADPLDDYGVFRFFALGLAGLFGGLIVDALAGRYGVPAPALGAATVIFFASALLTLPAAQLVTVRERGRARGSRLPPIDRRWAGTAGIATLGILAAALLLSAASAGTLLATAADLLGRLPDLLIAILSPFIIAAGYLGQALIELVHRFMGTPGGATHLPAQPIKPPPLPHRHPPHGHPPPFVQAIAGGIAALVATAIALALLGRAVGRRSGFRRDQAFEEERASVWSWEDAGAGWQVLLRRLRGRLRGSGTRRAAAGGPPRSIREAYRQLLRRGAGLGHARAAAQTPQEYLVRLRGLPIPDERDAAALTAAYMRIRYGDERERPEEVEQAAQAWERLDQALRQAATRGEAPAANGSGRGGRRADQG